MKTYKVGIKRFTDIWFYGDQTCVSKDYWTTVKAESEPQAKRLAYRNLCVQIAKNEFFTCFNVRYWKGISFDNCDMVIGG